MPRGFTAAVAEVHATATCHCCGAKACIPRDVIVVAEMHADSTCHSSSLSVCPPHHADAVAEMHTRACRVMPLL